MNHRLKTMDEMDACVFSSDMLYNEDEREQFKSMVARWSRALNETENTAPSRKEWHGMTDEDIKTMWDNHIIPVFNKHGISPFVFARAIEAKLKEKNG